MLNNQVATVLSLKDVIAEEGGSKEAFSDLMRQYQYCIGICSGSQFFQVVFDFGIYMQLMLKQDSKGLMWVMRQFSKAINIPNQRVLIDKCISHLMNSTVFNPEAPESYGKRIFSKCSRYYEELKQLTEGYVDYYREKKLKKELKEKKIRSPENSKVTVEYKPFELRTSEDFFSTFELIGEVFNTSLTLHEYLRDKKRMEIFSKTMTQHLTNCSILKIGKRYFILLEQSKFKFQVADYQEQREQLQLEDSWVSQQMKKSRSELLDYSSSEEVKQSTLNPLDKPEMELLISMSNEIKQLKHIVKNQKIQSYSKELLDSKQQLIKVTKNALEIQQERNRKLEAQLEVYKQNYEELRQQHQQISKNCYSEKEMKQLFNLFFQMSKKTIQVVSGKIKITGMIDDIKEFEQKVKNARLKNFINDTLLPKLDQAQQQYITISQYEIMREQVKEEHLRGIQNIEDSQKSSGSEQGNQDFQAELKRQIMGQEDEKEEQEQQEEDSKNQSLSKLDKKSVVSKNRMTDSDQSIEFKKTKNQDQNLKGTKKRILASDSDNQEQTQKKKPRKPLLQSSDENPLKNHQRKLKEEDDKGLTKKGKKKGKVIDDEDDNLFGNPSTKKAKKKTAPYDLTGEISD